MTANSNGLPSHLVLHVSNVQRVSDTTNRSLVMNILYTTFRTTLWCLIQYKFSNIKLTIIIASKSWDKFRSSELPCARTINYIRLTSTIINEHIIWLRFTLIVRQLIIQSISPTTKLYYYGIRNTRIIQTRVVIG